MATRTGAKRHTHKYRYLQSQLWACALPDCTHYLPSNVSQTIVDKNSICWGCHQVMTMGSKQVRMLKPICDECILKAQGINIKDAEAFLQFMDEQRRKERLAQTEIPSAPSGNALFGDD